MQHSEQKINIVLASDDHYAVLIASLLKSMEVNHHSGEVLYVYIISDGIKQKNLAKIISSINIEKISISVIESDQLLRSQPKIPVDKTSFPKTAYLRLFAPYVIPTNQDYVLYLDVDMIVLKEISELFKIRLGTSLFAAVRDWQDTVSKHSWGGIPNYKQLGIPGETPYFNSGLMLINAIRWRNENVVSKVFQCINENLKFVNFADQYGLNAALYKDWLELDPKWNAYARFYYHDPSIIHFLDIKPIFTSYNSVEDYKTLFYKYLRLTKYQGFRPISGYKRTLRKISNKLRKFFL